MAHLADTNCLLRWAQPHHPLHPIARAAITELHRRGESVFIAPQNLIEFWNVATRPVNRNGFGLTPAQADQELTRLEGLFLIAPDTPAIFGVWRQLVVAIGVSGVQVHDARLVAVMQVHGLTHIVVNP
jgi:predicted nucleic acid-binding protein